MRSASSVLAGAWFCVAGIGAASAQTLTLDQICPRGRTGLRSFSPASTMMAALDVGHPARRTLDLDGNGEETQIERLTVVLTNPCRTPASACHDDNVAIISTLSALMGTFSRDDITIERKRRRPTQAEIDQSPWLSMKPESDAVGSVGELLDPSARYLSVTCNRLGTSETAEASDQGDERRRGGVKPELRISSKLEEMSRANGPSLKDIDPATISIANDHVDDKLTFAIDAIVGLNLPIGNENTLIPFVQYQRTSVRDRSMSPPETSRSPDKLGLGVIASLRVATDDVLDMAPVYIVDYEKSSRVASFKVNWIPGFLLRTDALPVMGSNVFIPGAVRWGLTPRLLVQASHVFDAGTDGEIADASEYLRAGADLTIDLWGAGALTNLTGSVAYRRLFRLTAGPRDVNLFKANVQYWLDKEQHVSVGYIYERGLDEDTADRVNNWKIALGVRF